MNKLVMVLLVLGFLVTNSSSVFAERPAKGQPEKAAAPQAVSKKQAGKIQEMLVKRKAELNSTQWDIEAKPMSGKGKAEKDVLSFLDSKVSTKNMIAKGFASTNFSMRLLEDNETYTWETMQTSEKSGTAFWRGDIGADGIMRGVVSIRDNKDKVSDFNFHSLNSIKMTAEPSPAAVELSPSAMAE
ncbi:MAG: hypothetical protein Q8N62_00670 [Candidatus Omnitrophota bacterium]|nr:hypothetical protein [Candidatus Omnitrophota bacterium]